VRTVSEYALKLSPDQAKEMPMVDLAYEILKAANTPFYYRDLMKEIAKYKNLSEEEMMNVIAQVYTEINIDGRFACVGSNMWGLKRWYPVEKGDETVADSAKRPRIINEEDDLDDEEMFAEEEEEGYDGEHDVEDYDPLDDVDTDEFFEEDEVDDAILGDEDAPELDEPPVLDDEESEPDDFDLDEESEDE